MAMRPAVKSILACIQSRPRLLLLSWFLVTVLLFSLVFVREFFRIHEKEKSINILRIIKQDCFSTLCILIIPLIFYILRLSLTVFISLGLSSFLMWSLLQLFQFIHSFSTSFSIIISLNIYITMVNINCLKHSWDTTRKGPCTATITKLLYSSVDKSIYQVICSFMLFAFLSLPVLIFKPILNSWTIISILLSLIIQNICAFTTTLALLLIRNEVVSAFPQVSWPSLLKKCIHSIHRMIYSILHILRRCIHCMFTSISRIFIIILSICITISFGSIIIMHTISEKVFENIFKNHDGSLFNNLQPFLAFFLFVFIPIPILHLSNHKHWSNIIAFFTMLMIIITSIGLNIVITQNLPSLNLVDCLFLFILVVDGPFRFCISNLQLHRRRSTTRVLNIFENVMSQVIVPNSILLVICYINYKNNENIWQIIAIVSLTAMLYNTLFCPSALMLCVDKQICGAVYTNSERSSLTTDFQSTSMRNHDLYSTNSRKYSHASAHGMYQKRSFCMQPMNIRRASMPVVMQQRINHKAWSELAKKCQSMDSNTSPTSSSKSIFRRERSSHGSMVSSSSLTQPITEED